MDTLIKSVEQLRNSPIRNVIDSRMHEFSSVPRDFSSLFRELAFCILTAGTSAELGIKTINHLGETLFSGSQEEIREKLKEVYRFHTIRAGYLCEARNNFKHINIDDKNIRDLLVQNIKGIGMKEASHFLRNVGFAEVADLRALVDADVQLVDVLVKNNIIEKPKTLSAKKYLEIESVLKNLADKLGMSLAELDLYLWHMETGKVLK